MNGDTGTTGLYFPPPNENFVGLAAYGEKLPGVKLVKTTNDRSAYTHDSLVEEIKGNSLSRVIIAGEAPGFHKTLFARAMASAGKDPGNIILADFKELNAHGSMQNETAKGVLFCAHQGVPLEKAAEPPTAKVHPDTLVIGGGIAGIQASLEIANAGQKVFLVERTGTIGGHMAMFDKTFPTLDCAACILTPKMVEVGQSAEIQLMTYCEVKEVTGEPGDYTVRILKKARKVNVDTCIGCGTCAEKCPGVAPSEFDSGTTMRKAIYIPFPQAVPNKYMVDAEHCLYCQSDGKKCGVCIKNCPVEKCINLDEEDSEVVINVGNIIVATGFQTFDALRAERFGYGQFPNVVTSLEFERLVNASGPTGGHIKFRAVDKKGNKIFLPTGDEPKSVALIHCIGSRDENYNKYCSRVCCMYSLKLAHLIREKLPETEVYEYFIDMRAFGKGYEEFYERIKEEGVHVIRGRTAKVEDNNGRLRLRGENVTGDDLLEQDVDMVVLAVGLEPRGDAAQMASMLGIDRSDDGWFLEADSNCGPVDTFSGGISIAGVCQGPKDIPDTVAQASAAASRVLASIIAGKINGNIKTVPLGSIEERARQLAGQGGET